MSTRLFRCWAVLAAARHRMVKGLALALVALAGTVSGQTPPSSMPPSALMPPNAPPLIFPPPMDTTPKPWTGKRLPDGQPDLHRGRWDITQAGNGWLHNPQVGATGPNAGKFPPAPTRIIDPPDGLPPYQPWALAKRNHQATAFLAPKRPEEFDPQGQCLSGIPKLNYYVSAYTIMQSPGFIAFASESYHQFRVIPLDGSPHPGQDLKLWMGDGRGRWDGNTLIVDTYNLNGKSRMNIYGDFFSRNARLTERFHFLDAETMIYEVTIDDPTVFTRPWTMRVNRHQRDKGEEAVVDEIWEEDCKEWREIRPSAIDIPFP